MFKPYHFFKKIKLFRLALAGSLGLYAHSPMAEILYSDNFESSLGNWSNVTSGDNKNWTRDSGGTPSSGTGPSSGSSASTYYVYLETSSGSAYTFNDSAILLGPTISAPNIHLKFDYHMYGNNMGSLAVDVFSAGSWINDVWTLSGQQHISNSAAYTSADLDLSTYSVEQIRFRATAAGGYRGDMAIDNILIESLPTGPVAPVFLDNPVIKTAARQNMPYIESIAEDASDANGDDLVFSKVSGPEWLNVSAQGNLSGTPSAADVGLNQFVVEVSDGSLMDNTALEIFVNDDSTPLVLHSTDFESDLGDWSNITTGDNNNWLRHFGTTPSSSTGPASGADSSTYYAYFETSSGYAYTNGDSAILLGPELVDSNIHLNFDYHMYGANIGTLAVDGLASGTWVNNVWSLSGQQHTGSNISYTKVNLDLSSYGFSQLRFRAVAAGNYRGDIALDNIEIVAINPATLDSDKDGVVNPEDNCPNTPEGETVNSEGCSLSQIDSDNDGVVDSLDAFPLDPSESTDTDGDGVGNNADTDDDNDNILDVNDAFPLDPSESVDSDNDGIGNNADTDDDNDGVLDNNDAFPLDPSESLDSDGDGIGNNADTDDDNDGVQDNVDAFPLDPSESVDSDLDGIGNNADLDDDNDSLTDEQETNIYFTNPLSSDSDSDGMPDGWEVQYGLLPNTDDAEADPDGDGYSNLREFNASSDPTDADSTPYVPIDDLSLGTNSSCALVEGVMTCWGVIANYPMPASLNTPEQIGHDGNDEFCALQGNEVFCWGYASSMITDLQTTPVNNATSLHVTPMANTACVITNTGNIHCWGGTSYSLNVPPASFNNVQQMDMFQYHACAHDGSTVECWGRNTSFQSDVPTDLGTPIQVVVGGLHTCVLEDTQQVRCWGDNSRTQTDVPSNLGNVLSLDTGYYHTCAQNDVGEVHCWGDNASKQLDAPANLSGTTEIYSGPYNNCAMTPEGAVCWGRNDYGQSAIWYDLSDFDVGDSHVCGINNERVMCFGKENSSYQMVAVPDGILSPKEIGVGRFHNCVWADSGMHCWGKPGTFLDYPTGLTAVSEIDANESHTCAIADNQVICWGQNLNGVLNVPTNITQPYELFTGKQHNCVLDGDSMARCWGANYRFQSSNRSNLINPTAVAAGGIGAYPHSVDDGHSCVADDSGVSCWGSNSYNVKNVPAGLTDVIDLHAGWGTSCALQANGNVSCWGDFMNQSNVDILNIGNVTKIKGYNAEVCAQGEYKLSCTGGLGGALLINR